MSYKSVLITGANRGLGLEMVKQLLARKQGPEFVFAGCRQPGSAQELINLSAEDRRLHIIKIDSDDVSTIESAAKEVEKKLEDQGLNLLINNAGFMDQSGFSAVTAESLTASFRVNTIAPMLTTKALLPLLQTASKAVGGAMSSARAAVVNISSGYGSTGDGNGGAYPYRVSKAALNNFTHTLAYDLKTEGIIAICLCPGWVRTDLGGPNAKLSPEQSITSVFRLVDRLSEKHTGGYFDRSGQKIPW